jgi:ParB-like chromosome segregation protein Spo0J
MKLSQIKINPENPRVIKDNRFDKLVTSITEFPKMLELRPIIIDNDNIIIGGNMRYKALKVLGYKEIPDNWVKRADQLTEEERKRFIVEDNVQFGDWDYEMLEGWGDIVIGWGVDMPEFATGETPANDKTDYGSNFQPQYGVIVVCENDTEQEAAFNKLVGMGYNCRVVVT